MSSNRSISGARQRRAGEPVPTVGPRSNTSISSQPIFAKQQVQINQQRSQPKQVSSVPETMEPPPPASISIPKAFTLVTLRLGRIEQYIQQLQEEGGISNYDKNGESSVDDAFLKNILSRLENVEKNNKNSPIPTSIIDHKQLEELRVNYLKMEKEVRETKDLLMMMMMKYEKFALETNTKIDNFTDILHEHEQIIHSKEKEEVVIDEEIHAEIQDDDETCEIENEEIETISAVNLKEVIESELANEI